MIDKPRCRACGVELDDENWCACRQRNYVYICKECHTTKTNSWRKTNPEKAKAISTRGNRKQGKLPMDKNRKCALFLGVHIAERVLSMMFKDVERMPNGNPGYDIICNRNKKIDIKSSCKRKGNWWDFHINRNTTADYFLCLAFDNREDLNPIHVWLLPGEMFNHLSGAGICPSTLHRWNEYELDISKVVSCCNTIRGV